MARTDRTRGPGFAEISCFELIRRAWPAGSNASQWSTEEGTSIDMPCRPIVRGLRSPSIGTSNNGW